YAAGLQSGPDHAFLSEFFAAGHCGMAGRLGRTCGSSCYFPLGSWSKGGSIRSGAEGHPAGMVRSEEHTSELQSRSDLVCRLLLEKKKDVAAPPLHDAIDGAVAQHSDCR